VVKVKLEPASAPAAAKADQGAFAVLTAGKERNFVTLADAVRGAGDGDTIEIRGNGPFVTPPIYTARALTIRAAKGFRPTVQLDPKMSSPLLSSENTTLILEGIEFVLPS